MGKRLLSGTVLFALAVLILGFCVKLNTYAYDGEASASISQDDRTFTASEVLDISEEEVPLGTLSKHTRISWWWLSIVIVIGAAGAELISRRQVRNSKRKSYFDEPHDL